MLDSNVGGTLLDWAEGGCTLEESKSFEVSGKNVGNQHVGLRVPHA